MIQGDKVMDGMTQTNRQLRTAIRQGLGVLSLALLPGLALAGDLQGISYDRASDGSIQVHFKLSAPLSGNPDNFQIDNPARVALDLPGVDNKTGKRMTDVGLGPLKSIMLAEANGKTRAVFNLTSSTPYAIKSEGNQVLVTFKAVSTPTQTTAGYKISDEGSNSTTAMDRGQPIDFRRSADGAGRLLIRTKGPQSAMKIHREGTRIIVNLPDTRLTSGRYDVRDFGTPVQSVDVRAHGSGSRITLQTHDAGEHLAYQTDNKLVVEVKPVPKAKGAQNLGKKKYTGERLTLKFQNIAIRPLLQLIADFTGNNIVVSDSVKGDISLRLENVPWDQALDLILTTKGLGMRKNGNVIYVAPLAELAARDKAELAAQQQAQQLAPLRTDIVQINYAKAQDIAKLITGSGELKRTGGGATPQGNTASANAGTNSEDIGLLSNRGSIVVDDRSNSLIVTDTAGSLDRIRDLINKVDRPVKQVLIETRIVIATDNFARELGVRWGIQAGFNRSGSTFGLGSTSPTASTGLTLPTSGASTGTVSTTANNWNVNTPIAGTPTGSLGLAILGSNVLLNLELQAMQSEGTGEIVSSPKVITTNGHTAMIKQGTEIPYQSTTNVGGAAATNVSFKEAVLQTEVTPQITPNNNIIMDINVKKDEPDYTNLLPGSTNPPINTREVKTKVQVKNGQTVVLGGIYEFQNTTSVDKVPFFGDLPGIGELFKSNSRKNKRLELLIFVTPKIVNSNQQFVSDTGDGSN